MVTIIKPEYENCPVKAENQKEIVKYRLSDKPIMFPCDDCEKVFMRIANLSTHKRIHSGEKPFCCPYCGKSFSDMSAWSQHKREQHEEPIVYKSCEMCGRKFKRSKTLSIHKRKLHLTNKLISNVKKEENNVPKNKTHKNKATHPRKTQKLSAELQYQSLDKKTACPKRTQEFSADFQDKAMERVRQIGLKETAKELTLHESTLKSWQGRIANRPTHKCDFCKKTFQFKSFLFNHVKLHESNRSLKNKTFKEKRFSLDFKQKVIDFVNTNSLRNACIEFGLGNSTVQSIMKSGNFVCHICPRKCAYKRQLQRHLMSVHKIKEEGKMTSISHTEKVRKNNFISENPPLVNIKELSNTNEELQETVPTNDEEGQTMLVTDEEVTEIVGNDDKVHLILFDEGQAIVEIDTEVKIVIETKEEALPMVEQIILQGVSKVECTYMSDEELQEFVATSEEVHVKVVTDEEVKSMIETDEEVKAMVGTDDEVKANDEETQAMLTNDEEIKQIDIKVECTEGYLYNIKPFNPKIPQHSIPGEAMDEKQNITNNKFTDNAVKKEDPSVISKSAHNRMKYSDVDQYKARWKDTYQRKSYNRNSFPCFKCGNYSTNMTRHIITHAKEKGFRCHVCSASFGLEFNLTRHIRTSHDSLFVHFYCSQCDKKFTTRSNLDKHEKNHNCETAKEDVTPKKPSLKKAITCVVCEKVVKGKTGMKYHMRVHKKYQHSEIEERGFSCNQSECTKKYTTKKELEVHIKVIHLKVKSFKCTTCKKDFGRNSSFKLHKLRAHTKEKNFKCCKCPQAYKEKRNLLNHEIKAHKTSKEYN